MSSEKDREKSPRRQPPGGCRDSSDYGEHGTYQNHLLEQYKIFAELTDRTSARRLAVNEYFLALNTLLLGTPGAISAFASEHINVGWFFFISFAGMVVCYVWYRLLLSYRQLNKAKFDVIHEIEQLLPYPLFDSEWTKLGRGRDPRKYNQFTSLESKVPWVFLFLHLMIFLWAALAAFGAIPGPT